MSAVRKHIVLVCLEAAEPSDAVSLALQELGLGTQPSPRWRRFGSQLLAAWPEQASTDQLAKVRSVPGVRRVIHLENDARLHTRWPLGGSSALALATGTVGGPEPLVIAGPCTLEDEDQLMETAAVVAEAGAKALRCGVFKPRTSPYTFGGLGERGLELLARARERTGLPVVTETLDYEQMELATQSVDVIQIGSRNMHNSALLFRVGAHPRGLPVLLKRGFGATVDEFLHAAEYVLLGRIAAHQDHPGLILCERGIRTFEQTTRFTLDFGALAALRQRTHLPVIVDPSHAAGAHDLVPPLARAALAAGADGLLVEVHPEPQRAWCDGAQGLDFDTFRALMDQVAELRGGSSAAR